MAMSDHDYERFRRDFVDAVWRDIDPMAAGIEESGRIPNERLFPVLKEMRAFGLIVAERYGGLGH
jgi:alkylation response protein AidB-like acyl-CoA dehydrogenase